MVTACVILGFLGMLATFHLLNGRVPFPVLVILAELVLVAPGLVAMTLFGEWPPVRALLGRIALAKAFWAALLGEGFWLTSLGVIELQFAVWPPSSATLANLRQLQRELRLDSLGSVLAISVSLALVPAVLEEILFRGVAFHACARRLSVRATIVLTALLFAGVHADPYRLPFTFLMGLALAWLRYRSGSLWPGMLAHALFNETTVILSAVTPVEDAVPSPQPLMGLGALIAGVALSAVFWRLLMRSNHRP
jgi:membrane protease YdiL (CAAX protease family)